MRWADQAFSNCCHDLTEKAYSPVEIGSRGNHALANIGDKTDSVRTAWRFRHGQRPVARFVEQDLIFRPDRFKPCIDALGIKSLAGPVDEPSPRRIEPHDPAKIKNDPVRASALRKKPVRPRLDRRGIHRPMPAKTEPHGIAQALAGKFRTMRHIHP